MKGLRFWQVLYTVWGQRRLAMMGEYHNGGETMGKPVLVVLAAGMGSRYGGLKQIEPVGPTGEIIIDYSIYDALRAGFGKVVFVIRRDIAELFKATIGERFARRMKVDYVYQEIDGLPAGFQSPPGRTKPWGTGHALLAAAEAVSDPFAVINADDFYGQSSYALLGDRLSRPTVGGLPCYALVGFRLRHTLSDHGHVSRGICQCDAAGMLTAVKELTHIEREGQGAIHRDPAGGEAVHLTGDEYASMNMWGFTPDVFGPLQRLFKEFLVARAGDLKAEFYLPSAIDRLITAGQATCRVLPTDSRWAGVTYSEDRALLQTFIKAQIADGHYPSPLW